MNILGRGKPPELRHCLVLHREAVEGGVVGGAQHKLQVVHHHMLYVVHIDSMSHGLGGGGRKGCEGEGRG